MWLNFISFVSFQVSIHLCTCAPSCKTNELLTFTARSLSKDLKANISIPSAKICFNDPAFAPTTGDPASSQQWSVYMSLSWQVVRPGHRVGPTKQITFILHRCLSYRSQLRWSHGEFFLQNSARPRWQHVQLLQRRSKVWNTFASACVMHLTRKETKRYKKWVEYCYGCNFHGS